MIFKNVFRRQAPAPKPAAPRPFVPDPALLWSEISAAIGAAGVTIRGSVNPGYEDDFVITVQFPGFGWFKYSTEECQRVLKLVFPEMVETQLVRAVRYMHNRIVNKRRQDDDQFMERHSLKRKPR